MSKNSKSSVICVVSGAKKGVRPEVYAKRVEKAGGEDNLVRTYVCRESKRMLRSGQTVEQIRATLRGTKDLLPVPQEVIDEILSKKASSKTGATRKTNKPKKTKVQIEKEVEASVEVDPDIAEFLNSGTAELQTA